VPPTITSKSPTQPLPNSEAKSLFLELLHADKDSEVERILKTAGYWDDINCWRYIGDNEGNYSTIQNQQAQPEAALVEKIINSVDSRLMGECQTRGIHPSDSSAPKNINEAVTKYINTGAHSLPEIDNWPSSIRAAEAGKISVSLTGKKNETCISIYDEGEGQSPQRIPETFMNLNRSAKKRVSFVQGQFGMGGWGAIQFGGDHRLQLILSKRDPKIASAMNEKDPTNDNWGFTITRRLIDPSLRNPTFIYLAPVYAKSMEDGEVLSFSADKLQIKPAYHEAYKQDAEWGSLIKLYNYDIRGMKGHCLMPGGLSERLELLIPRIALPYKMHECREDITGGKKLRGKSTPSSYTHTNSGLTFRLEAGKGGNLEQDYPISFNFTALNEHITGSIYAFEVGKAKTYSKQEGVLFTRNGQSQGHLSRSFFSRKSVNQSRLKDSLLVIVECDKLSQSAISDLFMASRDRLRDGALKEELEKQLAMTLNQNRGLRLLSHDRRQKEIEEKLKDNKPLADTLKEIFRRSPNLLASLGLSKNAVKNPFDRRGSSRKPGPAGGKSPVPLQRHPSFFRFVKSPKSNSFKRSAELGRIVREKLETDVVNDYFARSKDRGNFTWSATNGHGTPIIVGCSLNLFNGYANLQITSDPNTSQGDVSHIKLEITDPTLAKPFVKEIILNHIPKSVVSTGHGGRRTPRTKGNSGGSESTNFPPIIYVKRDDDIWKEKAFTDNTALKALIENDGHTFYLNEDNTHLLSELKSTNASMEIVRKQYETFLVVMGMAAIQEAKNHKEIEVDDFVDKTTSVAAGIIIPMLQSLGSLED